MLGFCGEGVRIVETIAPPVAPPGGGGRAGVAIAAPKDPIPGRLLGARETELSTDGVKDRMRPRGRGLGCMLRRGVPSAGFTIQGRCAEKDGGAMGVADAPAATTPPTGHNGSF